MDTQTIKSIAFGVNQMFDYDNERFTFTIEFIKEALDSTYIKQLIEELEDEDN